MKIKFTTINPRIKIFKTLYKITNIQKFDLNSKYLIFSGIGNPSDFKDILEKNKFDIVKELKFPDHYNYTLNDFVKILNKAKNENLKIITTEKDFTKVPDEFRKDINFLNIDLIVENEDKLIELLNE